MPSLFFLTRDVFMADKAGFLCFAAMYFVSYLKGVNSK